MAASAHDLTEEQIRAVAAYYAQAAEDGASGGPAVVQQRPGRRALPKVCRANSLESGRIR